MTFTALIVACALLGTLFFFASVRRLRRRSVVGGMAHGATALILFLLAVCAALIGSNLKSYQRLSFEQAAGELQLARTGEREFNAVFSYPNGKRESFALRGDEWIVDARVLKWHAFANLLGFDTAYRLERIGGRYTHVEDERSQPHTAFDLNPPGRMDPFDLIKHYHSWVPWMDAMYGNSTYVPMADGALYEIKVSQSGLLARPLNQAAREAVGGWHQ